jgi:large subunit ribosomal protein L30
MNTKTKLNTEKIKLTQIGSGIGKGYRQNQTLIGLGLGKMHRTVILDNNASILGMVRKVQHLLKVETIN